MADTDVKMAALNVVEKIRNPSLDLKQITTLQAGMTSHQKDFTPLQIAALGFNVCNSWVAVATNFAVIVAAEGSVTLVFGVHVACVVYAWTAISLAEMASVYPAAGGQYHSTYLTAPKAVSQSTSYARRAITVFSWIVLCTAARILAAQALLALPVYYVKSYIPQAWHYFLVYQAINILCLIYNLFLLKRTLWTHDVGFALTITTFIVAVIVCLTLLAKQPSSFVLDQLREQHWME